MSTKHKLATLLVAATLSLANAQNYTIQYRGITLGEIDDLSTLDALYLKARVTNFIAKLLLKKRYFVYYGGDRKPSVADAKFRKDKNRVLFALYEAIKNRPAHKVYTSQRGKKLILSCDHQICKYTFYKRDKVTGEGKILFDGNNDFYELVEEKNNVVIKRK